MLTHVEADTSAPDVKLRVLGDPQSAMFATHSLHVTHASGLVIKLRDSYTKRLGRQERDGTAETVRTVCSRKPASVVVVLDLDFVRQAKVA